MLLTNNNQLQIDNIVQFIPNVSHYGYDFEYKNKRGKWTIGSLVHIYDDDDMYFLFSNPNTGKFVNVKLAHVRRIVGEILPGDKIEYCGHDSGDWKLGRLVRKIPEKVVVTSTDGGCERIIELDVNKVRLPIL